ncbi:MAG: FtsQ-type POTRA domain-containing protein [Kiritimatiellae bacterium]|nr:FtsQ-type POTRA domain-containing protein [Kiritimatiellia bacterium]
MGLLDRKRRRNRRNYGYRPVTLLVKARPTRRGWRTNMFALGAVLCVGLLIGLCVLGWFGLRIASRALFSENDDFLLRHIEVKSDGRLTAAYVVRMAKLATGMNLFAVDIEDTRGRIERISSVKSAELGRILPDTLRIRIEERVPIARLEKDGYLYLDREGRVLGSQAGVSGLPYIAGNHGKGPIPGDVIRDEDVLEALAILDICDRPRFAETIRIAGIDIGGQRYFHLTLRDGTAVLLGGDKTAKLPVLQSVLQTLKRQGRRVPEINFRFKEPVIPP